MYTIRKPYSLPFEVDAVYAAWVSSESVIPLAKSLAINPVVGGRFEIESEMNGIEWRMVGLFDEVAPNRRLAHSWEWNSDGEDSRLEVEFFEERSGERCIELLQTVFSKQELRDAHHCGWDRWIKGLKSLLMWSDEISPWLPDRFLEGSLFQRLPPVWQTGANRQ